MKKIFNFKYKFINNCHPKEKPVAIMGKPIFENPFLWICRKGMQLYSMLTSIVISHFILIFILKEKLTYLLIFFFRFLTKNSMLPWEEQTESGQLLDLTFCLLHWDVVCKSLSTIVHTVTENSHVERIFRNTLPLLITNVIQIYVESIKT